MLTGFASHRRSPKPDFCANRAPLIRNRDVPFARRVGVRKLQATQF
jgi:hypothetical protein